MKVNYKDGAAYVEAKDFIPEQAFENGQCFRYIKKDGGYDITAGARRVNVSEADGTIKLYPCTERDFEGFWRNYLDLDADYSLLIKADDENLTEAKSKYKGLKVLRQEPFETLISFIISANNNIGRIKGIIERICAKYGERIELDGGSFYAFPSPEALAKSTPDELRELGCGYRAPYITETAQAIAGGFGLAALKAMDYKDAKRKLTQLKGVGPKVADCVLLFSLGHFNAFPKDVWVKRVMHDLYGVSGSDNDVQQFAESKFGRYAGIAQQYLFHAARNGELSKLKKP